MSQEKEVTINDRPKSKFVKFIYALCIIFILWTIVFGLLFLTSDSTTEAHAFFKGTASSGLKGALLIGGLGFLLDKQDETKWFLATSLERKAIYTSRKKRKNAKNK